MMNLMAFDNNEFGQVRAFQKDGDVWFVGKDVCEAFGDTNYRRSLARIDSEDKNTSQISTPGGTQNMTVINESGLYSLLFQMQPQKAKGVSQSVQPQKAHHDGVSDEYPIEIQARIDKLHRFKRWVTAEVLPAIRKHGAYLTDKKAYEITHNPNSLADLLISLLYQMQPQKAKGVSQSVQPQKAHHDGVSDEYPIEIQARIDKLHRFKRWVTSEVLPAIRKHGVYLTDKKAYEITHNPNSLADLLIQAGEQLRKKDLVIQEMQPKALFADAVATSKTSILIGDLAKILKQNGVNIGQKRSKETV